MSKIKAYRDFKASINSRLKASVDVYRLLWAKASNRLLLTIRNLTLT